MYRFLGRISFPAAEIDQNVMTSPKARPISPHLQIYRPQLTAVMSSFHRISGLILSLAAAGLAIWLIALRLGPSVFSPLQEILSSGWSRAGFFLLATGFVYHLANGIRHLAWDKGFGYSIQSVYRSGWLVLGATAIGALVFLFAL